MKVLTRSLPGGESGEPMKCTEDEEPTRVWYDLLSVKQLPRFKTAFGALTKDGTLIDRVNPRSVLNRKVMAVIPADDLVRVSTTRPLSYVSLGLLGEGGETVATFDLNKSSGRYYLTSYEMCIRDVLELYGSE